MEAWGAGGVLARLGAPKPSRGSYAPPALNRYVGLDEATARLLRKHAATLDQD